MKTQNKKVTYIKEKTDWSLGVEEKADNSGCHI